MRADVPAGTAAPAAPAPAADIEAKIFVQVGAFGDPDNARRRIKQLRENGVTKTFVLEDNSRIPALYRVRIGPIADVEQYDALVAHLRSMGIAESHLVTE
jgi:rare lipoprotein A